MTADELAWVLVDSAEGSVLDHDALPYDAERGIADAAVRGAQAIAQACGYQLDSVALTWSEDVTREGLRLRSRLGCLGLRDAEAVPVATATALGRRAGDVALRLCPAHGAALSVLTSSEAVNPPVATPVTERRGARRRRTVSAVLGVAAAAIVGVLFLSAGAAPPVEPAGSAAEPAAPSSDSGWVSVPSGPAPEVVRKVVAATPSYSEPQATVPVQTYAPVAAATAAAPEPPAAPTPEPAEQPHLTGTQTAVGPTPGPDAPVPTPPTDAEMTELVNVFTALP
ncbi:hypothetical protein [Mycolicibacterium hippocampi]|uniref:hypothetical protein n=1 Tax=Mycolicibacterium hippocampi TaxID=659824 RepID=UPI0013D5C4E9|nr:hypothetical protein [Mycolicibacterium hippocampi]